MQITEALDSLSAASGPLADRVSKVAAKYNKTQKSRIESLTRLAYLLYVINENDLAEQLTAPLSKIPFENNYDYWVWIEASLVLNGTLARARGDEPVYADALARVLAALNTGNELQVTVKRNTHERFVRGETLSLDKIQDAENEGDFATEGNQRVTYLMSLLKIQFFDKPEHYPHEKIKADIEENVARINEIIGKIGLEKLTLFK